MDLMDKLSILTDSAKYDAACTSSGSDRGGQGGHDRQREQRRHLPQLCK